MGNNFETWEKVLQNSIKVNTYIFGWLIRAVYLFTLVSVAVYLLCNRKKLRTQPFVYIQISCEVVNMVTLCIIVFWMNELYAATADKPQVMVTLWNLAYFFWLMGHWAFVFQYLKAATLMPCFK